AIPAVILGDATSALGTAIARAGDVDGDGVDDLWVTARRYRSNRGAAYLVPGGAHLAARNEVDAVSATRITGETPDAALGESIAGDVDFDADGQRDVLIGSPGWYDAGWHVGAAYAMHGPFASGPPSGSHLRMTGTSPSALGPLSALKVGQSVAAGDVDGDGFDDVFVASPRGTDDSGSAGDPTSRVVLLHGGHDVIDAAPWYLDGDGDGYGDDATAVYACAPVPGRVALAGDCDDTLPAFHPGAPETDCANPEDRNCDGSRGMQDRDADGAAACLGDCDDRDSHQRPGGAEKCSDGLDNDCNGAIDDALATDATRWYPDSDHDGYGDAGLEIRACTQPALFLEPPVLVGGDCNDANASIHPAALELCNTIDDDCDGTVDVDASDPPHWYEDQDGDRFGDPHAWIAACTKPAGYVVDSGDCDDSDAELRPGTREVCDGVDNDCDGRGYLAGVQVAWDARVTGVAGTRFGQSIAWIADRGDGQSAWIVGGTKASEAIRRISPPLPGGDRSLDQASSLTLLSCPNDLPSCGAGVTRGDLDGDGFDDLVVTSPDADGPGAVDRGRVAVYRGPLD
ncbi:MAG TPA: MopE-related protein, partial [Myxococcota bacterium]|nr:MopE-related protein [Myxococcota bacterium]